MRLAQLSGLPRLRLTQQIGRGSVAPSTITAIARGLDLDPLDELTRFQEFESITTSAPAPNEIAAFIPTAGLLQGTVHRLNSETVNETELGEESYNHLALHWFARADDGNLRAHIQQQLGVAQPTLWKMLRSRLREDVALEIAQYASFPLASALVVSGVLTGAEAGWDPECRARWLNTVPLGQLLAESEKRLREVGKQVRSLETFENHLG